MALSPLGVPTGPLKGAGHRACSELCLGGCELCELQPSWLGSASAGLALGLVGFGLAFGFGFGLRGFCLDLI